MAFEALAFRSCDVIWVPRQIAQALPTARQGPGRPAEAGPAVATSQGRPAPCVSTELSTVFLRAAGVQAACLDRLVSVAPTSRNGPAQPCSVIEKPKAEGTVSLCPLPCRDGWIEHRNVRVFCRIVSWDACCGFVW